MTFFFFFWFLTTVAKSVFVRKKKEVRRIEFPGFTLNNKIYDSVK